MKKSDDHTTVEWDQSGPRDAPFAASPLFVGMRLTGRRVSYTVADTWYPSWGDDDDLYSPFTDGEVHGERAWSVGEGATTGHAIVSGSDPLDLSIHGVGTVAGSPGPYGGRYPSASLMLDGVWYYGTYCLDDRGRGLNWDVLGPFVGFRTSTDRGATWTEDGRTPDRPLFDERTGRDEPVRLGAPHFVDFGRNMQHSPDGYAYLVGHGSRTSVDRLSWISGDDIYLARARPSIDSINDRSSWQYFAGRRGSGPAEWTSDLRESQPVISWPGHLGCVTATYFPAIKKYLMCVTDGWPTIKAMNSFILEADDLYGPWRLTTYMEDFGEQAYFLTFPSKFMSASGDRAWLSYSANFTSAMMHPRMKEDPAGSRYAWCLQEVEFVRNDAVRDPGRLSKG